MDNPVIVKQYLVANQYTPVNLISLFRKMLSYKALMLVSAIIGILISLVWGLMIYKPTYNMSVSYSYKVSPSSTYSSLYGIQYLMPDNLVAKMNHSDTAEEYLKGVELGNLNLTEEQFLKPFNAKYNQEIISVNVKDISEEQAVLYKDYVDYCIESFNESYRNNVLSQLKSAKSSISDELDSVRNNIFDTDTLNASNYSYSITLNDRIKSIETQITEIEEGAIRGFSDYELIKISSRAKNMIMIVVISIFFGAFLSFLICFFDKHIYFSEDINDDPNLRNKLLSCLPLYIGDEISTKEYVNILSKLPEEVTSISVSEISNHAGAMEIANGLKKVSDTIRVEYSGCLVSDADILSDFSKYSINLIVLRVGIDTINQARNIVRDCRVKGVDNFYFVLYGVEPSDKMVTRFEEDLNYINYPIFSFRTLRQHYRKYYDLHA